HEQHDDDAEQPERDEAGEGHRRAVLGSSASRRLSPNTLKASVTRKSAAPGKTRYIGLVRTHSTASLIVRPHDGVGGVTPTPRNDSTASVAIIAGMMIEIMMTIVGPTFGSTWPSTIRHDGAPI